MKEHPILFSGPMVRAILDGRKTQTRRIVKPQEAILTDDMARTFGVRPPKVENFPVVKSPFGGPGDRLWVRETHALRDCQPHGYPQCVISYEADQASMLADMGEADPLQRVEYEAPARWRPSIHMPRWASRITLEVTAVRVERLQTIKDFDAYQEGAQSEAGTITGPYCMSYAQGFRTLWQSIYGPGAWAENPWVWVYSFRKVNP